MNRGRQRSFKAKAGRESGIDAEAKAGRGAARRAGAGRQPCRVACRLSGGEAVSTRSTCAP